ncbi:MAG: hypothetical protein QUS08_05460, partial [Methanothrix sp.]|nr:hypothetical protein [Methanothrix sp.]
ACSIPESCGEVEVDLKRLDRMLQAAHRSSIDIKNSYDFYILALKEFNKENLSESYLYYDRARYELTSAINEAKIRVRGTKFHSLRTLSFFFKLYGIYAIIFGVAATLFFSYLIYSYSEVRILDVPLWASFFAGLGSSAQILTGMADDLRTYGMVTRYKRLWYMAIPLLSMIFGYMAYLLFSSGMIAINAASQSGAFATMFVCFATGFLTNWLINRLSRLSRDL